MNVSSSNEDTPNAPDMLSWCVHTQDNHPLPLPELKAKLLALGIDADTYALTTGLSMELEPTTLADAGCDRYQRPLLLTVDAARAWHAMRQAAVGDGIVLDAISGYRSYAYQFGILERKLAQGKHCKRFSLLTRPRVSASTIAARRWILACLGSRLWRKVLKVAARLPGCTDTLDDSVSISVILATIHMGLSMSLGIGAGVLAEYSILIAEVLHASVFG